MSFVLCLFNLLLITRLWPSPNQFVYRFFSVISFESVFVVFVVAVVVVVLFCCCCFVVVFFLSYSHFGLSLFFVLSYFRVVVTSCFC